ncbi:hypothetical protein GMA12_17975 [Kocuria sediminis]|uniref:ATP-grasp domain-containing protein n=1 Tax=Kocuria sediminis TaxID=1038857 RepID=A0A6N8GPK7_9MICC|nr:ATP-grasp fold amidoligase family protein [Kocuria sediminis]MUN65001.1 hypothetical protein [Kocuria sediminis]
MTGKQRKPRALARQCGAAVYHGIERRLPPIPQRYFAYAVHLRRVPNLRNPRTFNEKISWRMLFDRRDLLAMSCDKIAMKSLAEQRASGLVRVPRVLWSGRDVGELAETSLPDHWVLKPNHRSGLVHFGHGPANIDRLRVETRGWVDEVKWRDGGEWAYSQADPVLLVEELVGAPGSPPLDYKFEVFDGKVQLLIVHLGRFDDLRGYLFDRNFNAVAAQDASEVLRESDIVTRPKNFGRMVEVAERIADGYDYLRVDLYDTGDDVWFGEITPYEGGGTQRFRPRSFDEFLGSYWTLPTL